MGEELVKNRPTEKDNVNHPYHYEGSCSLECIDVMLATFGARTVYDFCICNAFKYMWRFKNKNGAEDLDKAEWYIKKAAEVYWKPGVFGEGINSSLYNHNRLLTLYEACSGKAIYEDIEKIRLSFKKLENDISLDDNRTECSEERII